MTLVIDANVVVKWYAQEAGSAEAERLLDGGELLISPGHLFGEEVFGSGALLGSGTMGARRACLAL